MRKDFHMHPTVLKDAEKIHLFVEKAMEKEIDEICITDHMPLSVSKAKDRLIRGTVKEYCRRVRELAKEYEGRISIRCGIEVDFHPDFISEAEEVLECGEFDYVLASSHMHLFTKDYTVHTGDTFASLALENSIRACETGWFDATSHVDMFRFVFENRERFPLADIAYDPERHQDLFFHLFDAMNKNGMYLEINPHLAESKGDLKYLYPEEKVMKWALDKKVRFSYGSDAHKSESVGAFLDELERSPLYGKGLSEWEEKPFVKQR